ncbi:MAG: hypothetical protein VB674_12090 [Vicinamibacterales bacterium]
MRVLRFSWILPVAVVWLWLIGSAHAQLNQPVYPVYDGFFVSEDGTYVISYAYFSHNHDTVQVSLGNENAFGSEPPDRLQPTTFSPGHHRFQCVMVLDADFQGGLRWTLTHAGTTTSTSEDMLQYNWEFDDRTQQSVLRDVDIANAPRGVCLNRSPLVRVLGLRNGPDGEPPELAVNVGDELRLFGSARDEGLPRNSVLISEWRAVNGPGSVSFSAQGEPRTLATFDTPGTYELELRASDSIFESTTRVIVHVE